MAIPVFFTAELMPFQDIAGTVVDEALVALGNELKGFFDGKADFVIKDGHESVVGLTYDASATDPNLPVVIGTLVAGFRGVSEQEALTIAQTFSSKNFPRVTASLDQAAIVTHPTDAAAATTTIDAQQR
ncbi:hypothetical protein, partial [Mycobacterium timonense]